MMFSIKKSSVGLIVSFQFLIIGILIGESWTISRFVSEQLNSHLEAQSNVHRYATIIVFLVLLISITSKLLRSKDFQLISRSYRFDLLGTSILGAYFSIAFGGFLNFIYEQLIPIFSFYQLIILFSIPALYSAVAWLRTIGSSLISGSKDSLGQASDHYIDDTEIKTADQDLLNISMQARRFADDVLNSSSSSKIVYGLDAPWGVGKSSFMNICKEHWHQVDKKAIVYSFNPLRFEDRNHLLGKFANGLAKEIQNNIFLPEIRPLFNQYTNLISPKIKLRLPPFLFDLSPSPYTIDDAFNNLESALESIDERVIVIIDDLDRLNFEEIKGILNAVKKCFTLPNTTYIICYATENIKASEESNSDYNEVSEFLEKYISVKVSLFLDSEKIVSFIVHQIQSRLTEVPFSDEAQISNILEALVKCIRSSDFHLYSRFVGDLRKLKRFANILLFLDIYKSGFANISIDYDDLVHLAMLYINYPKIFRDIYLAETNGRNGKFSVQRGDYVAGSETKLENSEFFTKYLEDRCNEDAKFLLTKLFDIENRREEFMDIQEDDTHFWACFNGDGGERNLERYLKLFADFHVPAENTQHRFYLNLHSNFVAGQLLTDIFDSEQFSVPNGESAHKLMWGLIRNKARELTYEQGQEVIKVMLQRLPLHTHFEPEFLDLGFRRTLIVYLLSFIDEKGWEDPERGGVHNSEENIAEIADLIFGRNRHENSGIIDTLSAPEKGFSGFFDLMIFRLYCCADRAGTKFNVTRALLLDTHKGANTSGMQTTVWVREQMREMSQRCFRIFNERYIRTNSNFLAEIYSISQNDLLGQYSVYVESKLQAGKFDQEELDHSLEKLRNEMITFVFYQLANNFVSSGIGCGYYDLEGEEWENPNNEIRSAMNGYLFDVCFSTSDNNDGYKWFLIFMISRFERSMWGDGELTLAATGISNYIDLDRLLEYWNQNENELRNYDHSEMIVHTHNYTITVSDFVESLFEFLDSLRDVAPAENEQQESE